MRKLLKVVVVDDVVAHGNADALELAVIGGWQCCVKKGEFTKGQKAMYAEVDAMLPLDNPLFAFLAGRNEYTRDGKQYARIKTMKLRGQLSQGLLLPLEKDAAVDTDLSEQYGVIKYEATPEPVPGQSQAGSVGKTRSFPSFIPKTDQERVQNLKRQYEFAREANESFEVSVKLDGSSFTAYIKDGKYGVCSRNIELQLERERWGLVRQVKEYFKAFRQLNKRKKFPLRFPKWETGVDPVTNNFTALFHALDMENRLGCIRTIVGHDVAIQGEMVGPSIQGNFEGVTENKLFVYSIYDIDRGVYLLPQTARDLVRYAGLDYVPVLSGFSKLPAFDDVIAMADGPSALGGKYREGLVFKSTQRDFSFKVISNAYLLKEK